MRALIVAIVIAVGLSCGAAAADDCDLGQPVLVNDGFMTGQDLDASTDGELAQYVMGFVNGIYLAPLFAAPEGCLANAEACLEGRNNIQLAAILRKFVSDHPEKWHLHANTVTFQALIVPCIPQT